MEDCSGVSSPMSVLPVISKVFETLVAIQISNYADHAIFFTIASLLSVKAFHHYSLDGS